MGPGEQGVIASAGMATAGQEWRGGWKVVAAAVVGMAVSSLHAYSTGVMVVPLEEEFGWSRAAITSGMLICSVFSVLFAPFFGMFIDRFGPRRIALFGVAAYCAALAALSLAGAALWTWWLLWTFVAIALLNTKPTVWIAAVTSLFDRSRGLALAFVLSATGLSQAVTPALTFWLVERFDWRSAYVILGLSGAILALPVLWFWLSSAQDRLRLDATRKMDVAALLPGLSPRAGFRSGAFVRLAVGALAMSLAGGALTVNLVPVLRSAGVDGTMAVTLAGVSGLSAILGRLSCGWLLDRFDARLIGGAIVLLPIATCLVLLFAPALLPLVFLGVFLSGIAAGAEMDAIAYMATRSFGMRHFGLLFGTLTGILSLGIGTGPTLANLVYDLSGTYELVLWGIVPLSVLTAWAFFTVPPYPDFSRE